MLLTVRVTMNVCGEFPAPVDVSVTVSLYTPGPRVLNTAGLTVSARACGVVPVAGVTVRKFGPPAVVGAAVAVKLKALLELVI